MCSLFISAVVHIITGIQTLFFCFCFCFHLLYIASVHFCDTEKGGKAIKVNKQSKSLFCFPCYGFAFMGCFTAKIRRVI